MALFEEKYGEVVRVVKINDVSLELCGGTHVKATGEIGLFKILSETSAASGIRRIEAVCGKKAIEWIRKQEERFAELARLLKTSPKDVELRVKALLNRVSELEKEVEKLKSLDLKSMISQTLEKVKEVKGVKVLVASLPVEKMEDLRQLGDEFKRRLGSCVLLLIGERKDNPLVVCMIEKDLSSKVPANQIFKELSPLGIKGGGKPHLAQGTLKSQVKLEDVEKEVMKFLEKNL